MKYSFFIPNTKLEERIERLIELGIQQGGYVQPGQVAKELKGIEIYDSQLEIIHERLKAKNVIIKKSNYSNEESNKMNRKKHFIDDDEVDLTNVKQVNKCLTFDELILLLSAKYDKNLTDKQSANIKQKLANKIKHVETCHDCLNWCQHADKLYNVLYHSYASYSTKRFLLAFGKNYKEWEERNKRRSAQCLKNGHAFGGWEHTFNANTKSEKWSRTCRVCQLVENTYSEPEEIKVKKLIKNANKR